MPLAAIPAAVVGASIIGGGASIAGGLIASSGAKSAANAQVQGANYAADLQKQASDAALKEQQRQFNIGQSNIQPWLTQGRSGLANLSYLLGLLPASGTNGARPVAPPGSSGNILDQSVGGGLNGEVINQPSGIAADLRLLNDPNNVAPTDINGNPLQMLAPGAATGGNSGGQTLPDGSQAPYDLSSLVNPSLGAAGSLLAPWTEQFKAPDNITEQNDPGFQSRLKMGTDIIQKSAAARGNLLTGGTAKALNSYAQDYASNEYGNVYNRAYNDYTTRYNTFQNNQTNTYNRLAAMSGTGQTAANQLSTLGMNSANSMSNILMNSGAYQGNAAYAAGNARATGYQDAGNIWGGTVGGIGTTLASLLLNKKPAATDYSALNNFQLY